MNMSGEDVIRVSAMSVLPYRGGTLQGQPAASEWLVGTASPLTLSSPKAPTPISASFFSDAPATKALPIPSAQTSVRSPYTSPSVGTGSVLSASPPLPETSSLPQQKSLYTSMYPAAEPIPTFSSRPTTMTTASTSKYTDVKCCDEVKTVGSMLTRYKKDREVILKNLKDNIGGLSAVLWKDGSPLSIDNKCLCNVGKGDLLTAFRCVPCKSIGLATDYHKVGRSSSSAPLIVKCELSADDSIPGGMNRDFITMMIVETLVPRGISMSTDDSYEVRAKAVLDKNRSGNVCGLVLPQSYYGCDKFTNNILISWLVEEKMKAASMPHCVPLLSAFVCNRVGYNIYDFSDKITHLRDGIEEMFPKPPQGTGLSITGSSLVSPPPTSSDLKSGGHAVEIVKQVACIWSILSDSGFSYGNPTDDTIAVKSTVCSYTWKGVTVFSPISLVIHGFEQSSINVPSSSSGSVARIFPRSEMSDSQLYDRVGLPVVSTTRITMSSCPTGWKTTSVPGVCGSGVDGKSDITIYKVTDSKFKIFRHVGIPLFPGSYDFYCNMISLLRIKSFSDAFLKTDVGASIFNIMFFPMEREKVRVRLDSDLTKVSPSDVLRDITLRCDIVTHVMGLLAAKP